MCSANAIRRRTVLLEHTMPDGSTHVDWLVALVCPASPETRSVWTWRLEARPDRLVPGEHLPGVRLTDHRALYLHHEGRVTPEAATDRGTVRRLAVGSAVTAWADATALILRIEWRDRDAGGPIIPMTLTVEDADVPIAGTGEHRTVRVIRTADDAPPERCPRRPS